jgi:hypothetical protein
MPAPGLTAQAAIIPAEQHNNISTPSVPQREQAPVQAAFERLHISHARINVPN